MERPAAAYLVRRVMASRHDATVDLFPIQLVVQSVATHLHTCNLLVVHCRLVEHLGDSAPEMGLVKEIEEYVRYILKDGCGYVGTSSEQHVPRNSAVTFASNVNDAPPSNTHPHWGWCNPGPSSREVGSEAQAGLSSPSPDSQAAFIASTCAVLDGQGLLQHATVQFLPDGTATMGFVSR